MTSIEDKAREIGSDHGKNAASWVFDGNTTQETYRTVLAGIEDIDPLVMDMFREPSLSGEYADDYSESDLADDLDTDPETYDGWDDAADAYNEAASAAFWHEIERMAREALA